MKNILNFCGSTSAALLVMSIIAARGFAGPAADLRVIEAVQSGDRETLRDLLQKHADVNGKQPDGTTALSWAADRNDLEAADLLIRAGANVNAANEYGATPLAVACASGKTAMVRKLLEAGADPDLALLSGETPLMTAVDKENPEAVRLLLEHGAKTELKESNGGQTALMWAVGGQKPEIVKLLVDHGADVAARSKGGFTGLLFAVQQGDAEAARILLGAGADVNETAPKDGRSALMVAIASGHSEVSVLLLNKAANPNMADGKGYTALHYAAPNAKLVEVIKALLASGANPNARTAKAGAGNRGGIEAGVRLDGATPLFLAAAVGNVEAVRTLLTGGADLFLPTYLNTTPLHVAAGVGPPQARDWTDEEKAKLFETTKLLVELGADVNAVGEHGWTPLHGAAYKAIDSVVQYLVEKGAKMDVMDDYGQTPLSIASAVITVRSKDYYYQSARIVRKSTRDLLLTLGAKPLADSGIQIVGIFDEQQ